MTPRVLSTAAAATAFAGIAAGCGLTLVLWNPSPATDPALWLLFVGLPAVATAVVTVPIWQIAAAKPGPGLGAITGFLCVFAAYPMYGFLFGMTVGVTNPLAGVWFALMAWLMGVLLTGWWALPAAALLGAVIGRVHRGLMEDDDE